MKGKKCKCVEDVCNKCIKKPRKRNRKVKTKEISGMNLRFSQIPHIFSNSKASESNELISLIKGLLATKSSKSQAQTQTDAQDIFNEYSGGTIETQTDAPDIFNEYSGVPISIQTDAPDIFNKISEPVKLRSPDIYNIYSEPEKFRAPEKNRFVSPGFNTDIFDEYSSAPLSKEPIIYVDSEPIQQVSEPVKMRANKPGNYFIKENPNIRIFGDESNEPIIYVESEPMQQVSETSKMRAPDKPGNYFIKENPNIRIFGDETDEPIYVEAEPEPIIIENEYVKPLDFETVVKEANDDALLKGLEASKKETFRLAKEERRLKAEEEIRRREEASKKKEAELIAKRIKMEEERQREEAIRLRKTSLDIEMKNYDYYIKHSGKPITKPETIAKYKQKRINHRAEYINKLNGLNNDQLKIELKKVNEINNEIIQKSKTKEFNI